MPTTDPYDDLTDDEKYQFHQGVIDKHRVAQRIVSERQRARTAGERTAILGELKTHMGKEVKADKFKIPIVEEPAIESVAEPVKE